MHVFPSVSMGFKLSFFCFFGFFSLFFFGVEGGQCIVVVIAHHGNLFLIIKLNETNKRRLIK